MRRYGYPALLLVLLGIILAPVLLRPGDLLYPRGGEATDLTITHWPALAYNVRSLYQDGQIPLWRTTIASGGPWMANPLSGLTYPPVWIAFLLPINVALNLLLAGHLALAAVATYVLGRRALDLRPQGAALAGLAFAAAPWVSGQLSAGHLNITMALAWLPVALLGIHRGLREGRLDGFFLAAVAWAAALVNYIQIGAFVAGLSLAWFLLLLADSRTSGQRACRPALLLLVPLLALLLSAVLLLPMAESLPYLNRIELSAEDAGILSLPWAYLLTAIVPTYGGEPEQLVYLGLPIAVLVAMGLVLRRDRFSWFLVGTAGFAALFAIGIHSPLFPLLIRVVPGLGWLRVPPRIWLLVAFAFALLAGRGLDAVVQPSISPLTRRHLRLTAVVILVAGLGLGAGLALLRSPPPPAAWAMMAFTLLAGGALLLRRPSVPRPDLLAVGLLVLVAADLALVRAAWTEMRTPADAFAWGEEAAAYVASQGAAPGAFRCYSPSYSLPQHTALQHGLYLADGTDPIQLNYYADLLAAAGGYAVDHYSPTLPPVLDDASARPNAGLLGLLNVRYVVAAFSIEAEGLVLRERLGDTYVYENERFLPRAFLVAEAGPGSLADALLVEDFRPGVAQVVTYTPNRIIVQADLDEPGLLVLSEVWYPGWQARANGAEVPVEQVAGALRGIPLDAGSWTVELRYHPWTAWLGLAVSGLTGLSMLGAAVVMARRKS